jgi:hypothetical protein
VVDRDSANFDSLAQEIKNMANNRKLGWKERLLDEAKKLSVTVAYLWIVLSLFVLYRIVILAQYKIDYSWKLGFAFINALILAKFMLIADALRAGERFKTKPLLYSVLFRSAVFAVILMVCHVLEELLVSAWHGKSIVQSLSEMNGATLNQICFEEIIMFVVLIPFFATRELNQVLGEGTLLSLFVGPRPKAVTLQSKT